MLDIESISSNLELSDDGIWVARSQRDVSYPDDGNEFCFAIEDESYWFSHRNRVVSELVRQHSPGSTFFDIGGGNGCVSHALQSAGIRTCLIEPGLTGARNGRKRGLETVVQSTLEDAGFAANSMPSAGAFDVVEHIEDDHQFLKLLWQHLEPDGLLYVTVPAFEFLWSNDDEHAGHFRRYTRSSLSQLLTQTGFDVLFCSYLFRILVLPIFAVRAIPGRLGFRKSVSPTTTAREHSDGSWMTRRIVKAMLDSEFRRISEGKPILAGSSCLAVARKSA